jgi:hypothetical protein
MVEATEPCEVGPQAAREKGRDELQRLRTGRQRFLDVREHTWLEPTDGASEESLQPESMLEVVPCLEAHGLKIVRRESARREAGGDPTVDSPEVRDPEQEQSARAYESCLRGHDRGDVGEVLDQAEGVDEVEGADVEDLIEYVALMDDERNPQLREVLAGERAAVRGVVEDRAAASRAPMDVGEVAARATADLEDVAAGTLRKKAVEDVENRVGLETSAAPTNLDR